MKRAAFALAVLNACSSGSIPLHPPAPETPAGEAARSFAARNPQLSVVLLRPDGETLEVRDRETGVLFLAPVWEVKGGSLRVVPCGRRALLPEYAGALDVACLDLDGRRVLVFRTSDPVARVAAYYGNGGDPGSRSARFRRGAVRVYLDRRVGNDTRLFAVE